MCHRFITRSDPLVVAAFERAMALGKTVSATTFQEIKVGAGPPRGQIDLSRHMIQLDAQLAAILGATSDAMEHAADYSQSLTAGADHLRTLDVGNDTAALLGDMISRTIAMAERAASLESNLKAASTELSSVKNELARAKQESASDALTSLPNRRAFDSRMGEAIAVAEANR